MRFQTKKKKRNRYLHIDGCKRHRLRLQSSGEESDGWWPTVEIINVLMGVASFKLLLGGSGAED